MAILNYRSTAVVVLLTSFASTALAGQAATVRTESATVRTESATKQVGKRYGLHLVLNGGVTYGGDT